MDEFSGRTYHEPGSHVTLPLLMRPDLVLVPGQTLPLHLFRPQVKGSCFAHFKLFTFRYKVLTTAINELHYEKGTSSFDFAMLSSI